MHNLVEEPVTKVDHTGEHITIYSHISHGKMVLSKIEAGLLLKKLCGFLIVKKEYVDSPPEKSQEVSAVLKLMDKDYSFEESVDIVLIIFEVDRNQLLEELNYFI